MSTDAFHNRCNNKGPTVSIFKSEKGYIFGGYASVDWTGRGYQRSAPDSFTFTLINMYNISPTKFPNDRSDESIYDVDSFGPFFGYSGGADICINFSSNYTGFRAYKDVLNKGYSIFTGDKNNNTFNLKEIEVFKLMK